MEGLKSVTPRHVYVAIGKKYHYESELPTALQYHAGVLKNLCIELAA